MHENQRIKEPPSSSRMHHHNNKMNNHHRKQITTPLLPPTTNSEHRSSSSFSIFNSFSPSQSLLPITDHPQRRRFEPTPTPPTLLKSEPNDFLLPPFPSTTTTTTPFHLPSTQKRPRTIRNVVVPTSKLARQRRTRQSDKTRCLQKLIPLERQMDTATLYDQTYKYVKFLEAQITLLQSMPLQTIPTSSSTTTHHSHGQNKNIDGVEELCRLNRQQLLQVLMSSQVAQTVMYMNGWCVFSAEQLAALFNDREQQGAVVEQRYI